MADFDGSSLLRYMVDDPETFAQNLAKALEQAGKATAAYLKPRETGETPIDMGADIANVTKTLAHVGE
jgi:polyhydroxyalkanoate synthase